jgi:hypothetical protein
VVRAAGARPARRPPTVQAEAAALGRLSPAASRLSPAADR